MTTKTMFFTKGSLTTGIVFPVEVPLTVFREGSDFVWFTPPGWSFSDSFRVGRDLFHSFDDAVAHLETQRTKKVASLEKQTKKLLEMTFRKGSPK